MADWRNDALCAQIGGDEFFPEAGCSSRAARNVCGRCEVRAECLEYALSQPDQVFGVWGGTTEKERRAMREVAA